MNKKEELRKELLGLCEQITVNDVTLQNDKYKKWLGIVEEYNKYFEVNIPEGYHPIDFYYEIIKECGVITRNILSILKLKDEAIECIEEEGTPVSDLFLKAEQLRDMIIEQRKIDPISLSEYHCNLNGDENYKIRMIPTLKNLTSLCMDKDALEISDFSDKYESIEKEITSLDNFEEFALIWLASKELNIEDYFYSFLEEIRDTVNKISIAVIEFNAVNQNKEEVRMEVLPWLNLCEEISDKLRYIVKTLINALYGSKSIEYMEELENEIQTSMNYTMDKEDVIKCKASISKNPLDEFYVDTDKFDSALVSNPNKYKDVTPYTLFPHDVEK